ncbi:MAG: hypothetical protein SFY66_18530 [Oculatellaceae cyanobacterium bins.114]|nr:hypothetical protein [Oculatellaceae cyanobacterium bins.114]
MSPEENNRMLANALWEQQSRELFPYLSMSPEEYAAREGVNWLCFSFHNYCYQDEQFDDWIQRLSEILLNPNLMQKYQEELLTPEELERVRQRAQEEP